MEIDKKHEDKDVELSSAIPFDHEDFRKTHVIEKASNKILNVQNEKLSDHEPLLVRAAKGLPVNRPPAWMMRQAGRYMAIYRKLAEKHPSFRERSETTDLIVEISLQPWEAFHPNGSLFFLTFLPLYPHLVFPLT
ncbi:uroporphyrinogen decarboxylase 1, chloroplastic [Tanacetum coccineum]